MALATLHDLKLHLGLSTASTANDTRLTRFLVSASNGIRQYCRQHLGGVILSNSVASESVITSPGHGLVTGDVITILNSNSTPTIDGERTVTRLTSDTFSVVVNVTTAGTTGSYVKKFTEYHCGDGDQVLVLKNRPTRSIVSVHLDSDGYWNQGDDAYPAGDLLVEGTDYALKIDEGSVSYSGLLYRLNGIWTGAYSTVRSRGVSAYRGLVPERVKSLGNIRVILWAGELPMHTNLSYATCNLVAEMLDSAKRGGPLQSESLDYYSYERAASETIGHFLSTNRSLLARYREVLV